MSPVPGGPVGPPVPRTERAAVRERLSHLLVRPPSGAEVASWEQRLGGALGPLSALAGPGFVTVGGPTGSTLWAFESGAHQAPRAPFAPDAEKAVHQARHLALRGLRSGAGLDALLRPPAAPSTARVIAEAQRFAGGLPAIDGASLGLAALLFTAGRATGADLRGDVAFGVLDGESVGPVEQLGAKLAHLVQAAPGLRRVWVCPAQAAEAAAVLGPGVALCVVGTVPAALRAVEAAGQPAPPDSAAVADAFGVLVWALPVFDRANDRAIAEVAARWAPLSLRPEDRWRLGWIAAIAARHAAEPLRAAPPLDPSPDTPSPPALRRQLLSQLLQHAADGGSGDRDALLREVDALGADALDPSGLQALGAAARLHLSLGQPAAAAALAWQAVDGWQALARVSECSRPLCAALLAEAALAAPDRLVPALARAQALAPQLDPLGRAYLTVALHRARLRVDPAAVADALADASAGGSDRIVPARVWGEALLACGRPVDPALTALDADSRPGAAMSAALLRLRMAVEAGAPLDAPIAAVLSIPGQMSAVAERLLQGGRGRADVQRLLDCFPY